MAADRTDADEARDRDALVALIDWHLAMGADLALDEAPHDRFAEAEPDTAPATRAASPGPQPSAARDQKPYAETRLPAEAPRALPRAATLPPDEVAADARARAATATSLAELEAIVRAFDGCALKATAKQLAFADGTPGARVMLVGEAPGAEEDRAGRPFVGRAGQLLDRMLAAIGLSRADVYIANIVPWRPPGNRTPTPQEVAICLPFIRRQIELSRPEILVTLGAPATQTLTGIKDGIMRARGRWLAVEGERGTIRTLPMLHPAYLLRQPLHKRLAWRDLRALRRALDAPPELDRSAPV
ncbi:MAG: uracil-DNA glycosylase [Methylobacteriaceae bacterium]|nr:uracil-DNA glycosylase [Methylobacteriaceae bacterium]